MSVRAQLLRAACAAVAAAPWLGGAVLAAPAAASPAPHWSVASSDVPTNLSPGKTGKIIAIASNLGDAGTSGEVSIHDKLPAGLKLKPGGIKGFLPVVLDEQTQLICVESTLTCHTTKEVQPATRMQMILEVEVNEPSGTETELQNEVSASGGGATPKTVQQPVKISPAETAFGIEKYSFDPEEEDGSLDTTAGSHPFQLTTTVDLNINKFEEPAELPKEFQFELPPGMIGNPLSVPRCTQTQFNTKRANGHVTCPADTVIGVAEVTFTEPRAFGVGQVPTKRIPVFNLEPTEGSALEPQRGEPARIGIQVAEVPVVIDTGVRTGSDYGVNVNVHDTSEAAGVLSTNLIVWGTPGDPRHDLERGWNCAQDNEEESLVSVCVKEKEAREKEEKEKREHGIEVPPPKPFLTMPTSCGTPLRAPMTAQSWVPNAKFLEPKIESDVNDVLEAGSCKELKFEPSIEFQPVDDEHNPIHTASTPTGLDFNLRLPTEETEEGKNQSALKDTTVQLPEGLQLNPAAASGLQACTAAQIGFLGTEAEEPDQIQNDRFSPNPVACPEASAVGSVEIESPDLANPLTGSVYLAAEDTDPFKPPLVGYIVASDPASGVLVKIAGTIIPEEGTGRILSAFEHNPQVPFKHLKIHFFGGPRASLTTPEECGTYQTTTTMTPWDGNPAATPEPKPFVIDEGVGGGPCPTSPQPFAPGFNAGASNLQAGGFTNFTVNISRPDGQQALTGISTTLPEGVAGILASVTPCPEPPAGQEWVCGPESLLGHATSSSGLGGEPFSLTGSVYLTTGYDGAPFGLLVITPAKAGPFNLGNVDVRSRINVDPNTAAVTITTDPGPHGDGVPTRLKGVPVQLKQLQVTVDRPGFQFNPTNCSQKHITGVLSGAQGGSQGVSSTFQVANCESLPFGPKLVASTNANGSKLDGTNLDVTVTSPGLGQSNIQKVFLTIPAALPSRLSTIQKACDDHIFNANPASCDEGSVIGYATVHTPVLKSALTGPAYLVSHAGASFPDVEFVLQGEGITLIVDGKTDIKNSVTYSRFESAPDAPFTTFETILPAGPHSALTVYNASGSYNVCSDNLEIPTELTGQNGAIIKEITKVNEIGCRAVVPTVKKETPLEKALKACKHKYAKHKKKRLACEKAAHKKYGPKKKSSKKKK